MVINISAYLESIFGVEKVYFVKSLDFRIKLKCYFLN